MLAAFFASLVPGLFWLWYFNRYDTGDKEPVGKLALCVFFGALAVIPALVWEAPFRDLLQTSKSLGVQLALSFLVVGLGEEFFKLMAAYFAVYKSDHFNEPMDGIIYAIAASIGFSAVENMLYISAFGLVVAPLRGTVASLAHIAFSGLAGYFLGKAKFSPRPLRQVSQGLTAAAFAHGLYDFLLITQLASPLVLVFLILGLQYVLFMAIRNAAKSSQNR
ncbi:MAG: PrsW family intramembrane metalloprotease [Firmicutes bacterium]|nr:PrsW family intramembrane metalloprotease [Bacillota bacterium]